MVIRDSEGRTVADSWRALHEKVNSATGRNIGFIHAMGWWWQEKGHKLVPKVSGPFNSPKEACEAAIKHFAGGGESTPILSSSIS